MRSHIWFGSDLAEKFCIGDRTLWGYGNINILAIATKVIDAVPLPGSSHAKDNRTYQHCGKHDQGVELSATSFKVFQTFTAEEGD